MNLVGASRVTEKQAKEWAKSRGATQTFQDNAKYYWQFCRNVGINPVVAYAQYAHETGFGKFGGVINESYCNPCGLKVKIGGGDKVASAHKKFNSWAEGIAAHVDHLALYAGVPTYPRPESPDPRHFPYLKGTAKTVESLHGKWASDYKYVEKLNSLINELINSTK